MTIAVERAPVRPYLPVPYLRVDNAASAIAFYSAVFGATEVVRLVEPSGRVAHAELRLGEEGAASIMLSEEYPEFDLLGPRARGGSSVALQLYVDDVDAVCATALAAGATQLRAPTVDPCGDRSAKLLDPCGHEWMIATRVEEVTPEQMVSRFASLLNELKSR